MKGAGADRVEELEAIFFPDDEHVTHSLLTLSQETYLPSGANSAVITSIKRRTPSLSREPLYQLHDQRYQHWLQESIQGELYTDGSFVDHSSLLDIITNRTVITAQAAVVKRDEDGAYHGLVVNDPNYIHDSSMSTELLAQFIASAHPERRTIRTDCKSAIALHSTTKAQYIKHPLASLINRDRKDDFNLIQKKP
jgi:hypothetical protein